MAVYGVAVGKPIISCVVLTSPRLEDAQEAASHYPGDVFVGTIKQGANASFHLLSEKVDPQTVTVDLQGICPCEAYGGYFRVRGELMTLPACPHAYYEDPDQVTPCCMAKECVPSDKVDGLCRSRQLMIFALRQMEAEDGVVDAALDTMEG